MSYQMFIDDERFPAGNETDWIICRTLKEVTACVALHGMPNYISFDHDLGDDEPNGFEITKMLVDYDLDALHKFPSNFAWYIHSQNPIGKANIDSYLANYFNVR
jgi:hypothetical protein